MKLPHIPARMDHDELAPEEVVPLLDAYARLTPAFHELRETVWPMFAAKQGSYSAALDAWQEKYRLLGFGAETHNNIRKWCEGRFSANRRESPTAETHNNIRKWCEGILLDWTRNEAAREALRVDQGRWEPGARIKRLLDLRPALRVEVPQWNYNVEPESAYRARVMEAFQTFLDSHVSGEKARLRQNGIEARAKRERKYDPALPYDWLVLHRYHGLSDGQIAMKYRGIGREAIKKARIRLADSLRLVT
jgi:hypothetical protein